MKYTQNLGLKKPESLENVLVEDLNENFDKIDEEISKISDPVTGVEAKLTTHLAEEGYNLTLVNGFTGTITYTKDGHDNVSINLQFTASSVTNDTIIGTLPAKFRPPQLTTIFLYNQTKHISNEVFIAVAPSGNLLIRQSATGISIGDNLLGTMIFKAGA